MKHSALPILLLLALPVMAWAEDDFNTWLQRAQQGDATAQCEVGYYYDKGKGVEQDDAQAVYWYRKSAEQGHAQGQNNLGVFYRDGRGVAKDYEQAIYWLRKSAEQGRAQGQNNLGYMYNLGLGVQKDYVMAVYWYRKAAEQEETNALANLGYMYEAGQGVEQDYTQAAYWYRKAAEKGNRRGQNNLGVLYRDGKGLTRDYTQAVYWLRKSAEQDYNLGQTNLGYMYDMGYGVARDDIQAMYWYRKAAEQGEMYAMNNLGVMYENGRGVSKDMSTAMYWYHQAADKGHENAQKYYQRLYALGYKEAVNTQQATARRSTRTQQQSPYQAQQQPKQSQYQTQPQPKQQPAVKTSLIDTNIPTGLTKNENTFVVIIANEDYKNVSKVPFALNDGRVLAKYCRQTLGVPAKQVKLYENATYNDIRLALAWLGSVCNIYNGEASVIFYYTGHGIPDESDKSAYLLPVDGDGRYVATGYKMDELYRKLGEMPAKSVTVLLDACFSGATRDGKMVAQAKGVALKVKKGTPQGNTVVLAAAQGDETAGFNEEEGHGLFTYYLLKKVQETKGDVTLQELSQYIIREVSRASVIESKLQTPCVTSSADLGTNWQNWKLR